MGVQPVEARAVVDEVAGRSVLHVARPDDADARRQLTRLPVHDDAEVDVDVVRDLFARQATDAVDRLARRGRVRGGKQRARLEGHPLRSQAGRR
jgi:hypothetical protein